MSDIVFISDVCYNNVERIRTEAFFMIEFFTRHAFLFSQIFGFSAMAVAISTYQFNKHKIMMILLTLCSTFWCLHFLCLGAYTAVALNVINLIRNAVYGFRDKKWAQSNAVPAAFLAVTVLAVVLTWKNIWDIFPLVAAVFATLANWQTDTRKLRYLTYPVSVGWLVYNIVNHSVAGMCNEIFTIVSLTVGVVRYDILKKSPKKTDEKE